MGLVGHRDCDFSPRAVTGSALPSPLPSADWRGPVAARCGVPGAKGLHVRLAALPSRSRARRVANDRAGFGLRPVALGAFFPGGGGSFTPARLALESPMAIACLAERAPCFPRVRVRSLRARTPACVDGDFAMGA